MADVVKKTSNSDSSDLLSKFSIVIKELEKDLGVEKTYNSIISSIIGKKELDDSFYKKMDEPIVWWIK